MPKTCFSRTLFSRGSFLLCLGLTTSSIVNFKKMLWTQKLVEMCSGISRCRNIFGRSEEKGPSLWYLHTWCKSNVCMSFWFSSYYLIKCFDTKRPYGVLEDFFFVKIHVLEGCKKKAQIGMIFWRFQSVCVGRWEFQRWFLIF